MTSKRLKQPVRGRILETASRLFYEQGYQATGINEIIKKSGVAKASFYSQFPSKDDLCFAYVQDKNDADIMVVNGWIASRSNPFDRFMSVMDELEGWLKATDFKGCGFLNLVPEIVNPKSPIRMECKSHYERLKDIFRNLSQDLIDSNSQQYGHLDADQLALDYLMLLSGVITLGEIYHDVWPVRHGRDFLKRLIEP